MKRLVNRLAFEVLFMFCLFQLPSIAEYDIPNSIVLDNLSITEMPVCLTKMNGFKAEAMVF